MRRVLWVITGTEKYGGRRAIETLSIGVQREGWKVDVLSLRQGETMERVRAAGLPVKVLDYEQLPGMHLATSKLDRIKQLVKLQRVQRQIARDVARAIDELKPDAVHVLSNTFMVAVGMAAKKKRVPCFWEMTAILGDYAFGLNQKVYSWLFERYDMHPLPNSAYTARTLGKLKRPARVMYLGADETQFTPNYGDPAALRSRLGIAPSDVVFTIVARIDSTKGQRRILEALTRTASDAHLVLVGAVDEPAEEQKMRALAESAGMSKRLHLVGLTPEPQAYLAISDIVVNARVDPEPFGLAIIEGMMMGKPILVHALGGPAETVVDGVTGWHMNAPTVEAYAEGVRRALADRAKWPQMGEAARKLALEKYSQTAQARAYMAIVEEVLASPR